jgi:hypothetical protein
MQPKSPTLADLLRAIVTEDAVAAIADAFEANYPVSYDPATGVLADAMAN